jgi:hypothetical protein
LASPGSLLRNIFLQTDTNTVSFLQLCNNTSHQLISQISVNRYAGIQSEQGAHSADHICRGFFSDHRPAGNLQLFSVKYKLAAENNALLRKVIYPDRGIIFDRKRRAILENSNSYDLMVVPSETKGMDTLSLCGLLNIDTAEYRKRIRDLIFKNGYVKQSIFQPLLSTVEMFARLNENIYKFPGFSLTLRSVRTYPYSAAANVLGYIREVDTTYLRNP